MKFNQLLPFGSNATKQSSNGFSMKHKAAAYLTRTDNIEITITTSNHSKDPFKEKKITLSEYHQCLKDGLSLIEWRLNSKKHPTLIHWRGQSDAVHDLSYLPHQHTGLICLWIYNINADQVPLLAETFATDQYTCLQSVSSKKRGILITVKTKCNTIEEETAYYQYLITHYKSVVTATSGKLAGDVRFSLNQIKKFYKCSDAYYNATSQIVSLHKHQDELPVIDLEMTEEASFKEPLANNDLDLFATHGIVKNCTSPFDDERKMSSFLATYCQLYSKASELFLSTDKWFSSKGYYSNIDASNGSNRMSVMIDFEPNFIDIHEFNVSFSGIQSKERKDILQIQYDPATNATVLSGKAEIKSKSSKGYREAIDQAEVNVYLVALLETGQIPQGEVQQLLETKCNRKNRTIRNTITRIISDQSIHKTTSGKSVIVAKRNDGNKHYLYLKPIN